MRCDGLIVGLGNPGPEYAQTRHNIGFMTVDAIMGAGRGGSWQELKTRGNYELWKGSLPGIGGTFLMAKPMTFMNLSGQAVQHILHYYDITPENMLVVHDELDLPLGRLRFKYGGGVAGHNGLSSIVESVGTRDFHRLRLGIGRPARSSEMKNYVLSRFSPQEAPVLEKVVDAAVGGISIFFGQGANQAMQQLHTVDFVPCSD